MADGCHWEEARTADENGQARPAEVPVVAWLTHFPVTGRVVGPAETLVHLHDVLP